MITIAFRYSYLSVYKDLWMSKSDRLQEGKYGIDNENLRKLFSKDNSEANSPPFTALNRRYNWAGS